MRLHIFATLSLLCVLSALPLGKTYNSSDSPIKNGTGDSKYAAQTPLQMHAAFFDRDKDGIIYVKETYQGLRAIGVNAALAVAGAAFINGALSSMTKPPGSSISGLPIYLENISKGKHGSDTGAFDSEGRFVPEKFEQIFTKYAKTNPNALSSDEVDDMLKGNEDPGDTKGQLGSKSEWKLLYNLAKDKDGFLQKDTIKSVYDGTLFYKLEKDISASKN